MTDMMMQNGCGKNKYEIEIGPAYIGGSGFPLRVNIKTP